MCDMTPGWLLLADISGDDGVIVEQASCVENQAIGRARIVGTGRMEGMHRFELFDIGQPGLTRVLLDH